MSAEYAALSAGKTSKSHLVKNESIVTSRHARIQGKKQYRKTPLFRFTWPLRALVLLRHHL